MVDGKQAAPEFSKQFSSFSSSQLDAPDGAPRDLEGERATFQAFPDVPWPKVSVIIPTLNEARNLAHVFPKLRTIIVEHYYYALWQKAAAENDSIVKPSSRRSVPELAQGRLAGRRFVASAGQGG
jgi:hypothetical protein